MAISQPAVIATPLSFTGMPDFSANIQQNLEVLFEQGHEHSVRSSPPTEADGIPGSIVPVFDGVNYRLYVKFTEGWKYCNLLS